MLLFPPPRTHCTAQHAAASSDAVFHDALFASLVDMGAVSDLLGLQQQAGPSLERFLVHASGLASGTKDASAQAPVGPLNQSQVLGEGGGRRGEGCLI